MGFEFGTFSTNKAIADLQKNIKGQFDAIEAGFKSVPESRTKSIFLTKLEEAFMWALRAVSETTSGVNSGVEATAPGNA